VCVLASHVLFKNAGQVEEELLSRNTKSGRFSKARVLKGVTPVRYGDPGTDVGTQQLKTNAKRSHSQLLNTRVLTLEAENEALTLQLNSQPSAVLLAELTSKLEVAVRAVSDSKTALTKKTLSFKNLKAALSRARQPQDTSSDGVRVPAPFDEC
jgi:hypothetical protein